MRSHNEILTADSTRAPRRTVNVDDRGRFAGNSALWLILGGDLVALALYFFVFPELDVAGTTDGDSTIVVDAGADSVVEGAAGAVDGATASVGDTAEGAVEGTADAVDDAAHTTNVTTTPAPGN